MTAPTLTSEQREALAAGVRAGVIEWEDTGSPLEDRIYGALLPVVAVMVADAAHEAEAKPSGLLALLQALFYASGVKQSEVAQASGYSEKHVSQMLHGKAGTLTAFDNLIRTALELHDAKIVAERDAVVDALADLRGAVEALAGEWQGATCQTDGAPCSWHRVAGECAADLRALLNASSNP
jgi:hypothetical protein